MNKLLKEWNRLAFSNGTRLIKEGQGEDPALAELVRNLGFYFAGTGTVVLGDLDEISGKEYRYEYPCDDPYEQGPFHVQVSAEDDGTYEIHDYTGVEPEYVSQWPLTDSIRVGRSSGYKFETIEKVFSAINQMVVAYDEFMEVYEQIRDIGAVVDEYYPYIDHRHPEVQKFKKH